MVFFRKYLRPRLERKTLEDIIFYPGLRYYNDEIMINIITHFHTDEKLFELGCIENDFAKYVAKFCIFNYSCFAHYNFSK